MRRLLFCIALTLSFIVPVGVAQAQPETKTICPEGDVECVSRALDERLRIVIENMPILDNPALPVLLERKKAQNDATSVVLAKPGDAAVKKIPAEQCGKGMLLNVTGQEGAIGYMQCGVKTIQCQIKLTKLTCSDKGEVESKAEGFCGVSATSRGPAIARCESYN